MSSFPQQAAAAPSIEQDIDVVSISDVADAAIGAWKQQQLAYPEPFLTAHQLRKRNKRKRSAISKSAAAGGMKSPAVEGKQAAQPAAQQPTSPPVLPWNTSAALKAVASSVAAADQPIQAAAEPATAPGLSFSRPTAPIAVEPTHAEAHQPSQSAAKLAAMPPMLPKSTLAEVSQQPAVQDAATPQALLMDTSAEVQTPGMPSCAMLPVSSVTEPGVPVMPLMLPVSSQPEVEEPGTGPPAAVLPLPLPTSAEAHSSGTHNKPPVLHVSTEAQTPRAGSQVTPDALPISDEPRMPAPSLGLPSSASREVQRPGTAGVATPSRTVLKQGTHITGVSYSGACQSSTEIPTSQGLPSPCACHY